MISLSLQEKLPWHSKPWEFFLKCLQTDRVPQAILLTGPAGLGKQHFAEQMARRLLCQSPEAELACGQCQACQQQSAGFCPDLYYLMPEEGSNIIKIDAVRALTSNIRQTSQLGGLKIVLICPAEAMNRAAANALLKTLEEPNSDTKLILVSHQPEQLLATIRSRCQVLPFVQPETSISKLWLKNQGVSNALEGLSLTENLPLAALAYLKNEALQTQHQEFFSAWHSFMDRHNPIEFAAICAAQEGAPIMLWLQQLYIDILRLQTQASPALAHSAHQTEISQQSSRISVASCFNALDAIIEMQKTLHKQPHLNLQLQLESLFIDLIGIHGN
jgi:DNA polymerase-3 subunit delta'